MAVVQAFSCKFDSATTDVPPAVASCDAFLQQYECVNGRAGLNGRTFSSAKGFHFHEGMGNTLTLKCPIPAPERALLQSGLPVNVTLVQGGRSYRQRTVYPHEQDTPEAPLVAVLYYNLLYENNAQLLPEWFYFALLQGVGHVYIYAFHDYR